MRTNEIELTDESILLRPYGEADAEQLYAAVRESILEVSRWLPWCHENYSIASQRVAENAGAIREGVARKRLLIHGESHDAVLYSLVPADFGLPTGL